MSGRITTILDTHWVTPLLELPREAGARVVLKCEHLQPIGSVKGRGVQAWFARGLANGRLREGVTLVEVTTGETGLALASLAASHGMRAVLVVPADVSEAKLCALRALGAEVHLAAWGDAARAVGRELAEARGAVFVDQHGDATHAAGYEALGVEIGEQAGAPLHTFVAGVGTGTTLAGVARGLRQANPAVRIVGAASRSSREPESGGFDALLEGLGGPTGAAYRGASIDSLETVDAGEALRTMHMLARRVGVLVGPSTGAVVRAAMRIAASLPESALVVALAHDRGEPYLSTHFNPAWLRARGIDLDRESDTVASLLAHKGETAIIAASPRDTVREVIHVMKSRGFSQLPIVGAPSELLGLVAEVDLLRHLVSGDCSLDTPVVMLANRDYALVTPSTSLDRLRELLSGTRMAIVTAEDGRVLDVIARIDLIDFLARAS